MEFNREYVEKAMRTNKKGRDFKDNILNACLGLCGETAELVELLEIESARKPVESLLIYKELGDIYWYVALAVETLEIEDLTRVPEELLPEGDPVSNLVYNVGIFVDVIKKHVFQGHEDLDRAIVTVRIIRGLLEKIASNVNVTEETVLEMNIAKLKARFPEGFKVSDSVNRKE